MAVATIAVFVIGLAIGRTVRPAPQAVVIQRGTVAPNPDVTAKAGNRTSLNATGSPVAEEIYVCGARTKKGRPCSRRVHGFVRCWQHKGMPAMLPPEKLVIRE